MAKLDISSSALEKGLDIAKGFLDKLITPGVEETGLLIQDQVRKWRFNNQVKMLVKAEEICKRQGISPKSISLKVVCPLLEYASLEEDEVLQEKWAVLLSNLVDSEQNLENHVFPYLLSQISRAEFGLLERTLGAKQYRVAQQESELAEAAAHAATALPEIEAKLQQFEAQRLKSAEASTDWTSHNQLRAEKRKIIEQIELLEFSIPRCESIPEPLLAHEMSNLQRLGLIDKTHQSYGLLPASGFSKRFTGYPGQQIPIVSESDFILTELGELFARACAEKSKSNK